MLLADLIAAVGQRKVIAFTMRGQRCTAEPHAVGVGHDGKMRFSAYQTSGPTRIAGFAWMYESVWNLAEFSVLDETFEPRPERDAMDGRFISTLETV